MKRVLSWVVPGGIFLAVIVALILGWGPEGLTAMLGTTYPWVAFGFVLLLGAFFHRSRVVLFVFGLSAMVLVFPQGTSDPTGFFLVGGLLVVSMGILALSQDRGVLSTGGLLQMMVFLVVFFFGMLLLELAPGDLASFLALNPLSPTWSEWSGLPQPVFLAFAFAIPTALLAAFFREGPVERGIFWSLLIVALALRYSSDPGLVGFGLTCACLTLGLSVMETSYAMAYKDDLTGLPARRALLRDLNGMSGEYAAAMVDVDHFKKFNDRYGHDVGDQVLRMVASRLSKVPGGGRAYRYGGEEFTLLFPGKNIRKTLPHLKEVRRSVEDATFTLRSWRRPRKKPVDPSAWRGAGKQKPKLLSVTISIGVADSSGRDPSPEVVLKKADQALYRAKEAGRNQVSK
ncbi:MAG: GGDEF domain-containing protein [Gemmatimonadetes bacterium]|nr:GGDEF domain-containing protein [Gemmatimonadota bacterium]NNM05701.1 GGDEF domain-containing protein [Gemmatimonadota bacterium]